MPAYVGNPLAGDPIWEASSALELRIAITTKQVSRAGHPSDLLVAKKNRTLIRPASIGPASRRNRAPSARIHTDANARVPVRRVPATDEERPSRPPRDSRSLCRALRQSGGSELI